MKKCPKTDTGEHIPEKEIVYVLPNFTPKHSGFYVCRACGIYIARKRSESSGEDDI